MQGARRGPQGSQRVGGWNQAIPPGVERCECVARRLAWARLSPFTGGCCARPCCTARQSAVMTTAGEVYALRARAQRERWICPRCGEPVAAHWRNFSCVDAQTRAIRQRKGRQ